MTIDLKLTSSTSEETNKALAIDKSKNNIEFDKKWPVHYLTTKLKSFDDKCLEKLANRLESNPFWIPDKPIRARNLTLVGEFHLWPETDLVVKAIPKNQYLVLEIRDTCQNSIDDYVAGRAVQHHYATENSWLHNNVTRILDAAKQHNVKVIAADMGPEERLRVAQAKLGKERQELLNGFGELNPVHTLEIRAERDAYMANKIKAIPNYQKIPILVYCGIAHVPGIIREIFLKK